MASKIKVINDFFKLPIYYNKDKKEINTNIITDLELISTINDADSSYKPLYHYAFPTKTCFGKQVTEQFAQYYTTDKKFLKDTQKLLKNYKNVPEKIF